MNGNKYIQHIKCFQPYSVVCMAVHFPGEVMLGVRQRTFCILITVKLYQAVLT